MRRWTWLLLGGWLSATALAAQDSGQLKAPGKPQGGPSSPSVALLYSADGKLLVSADGHSVRLWDAVTGRPLRRIDGAPPPGRGGLGSAVTGNSLALAPDGRLIAAYHDDQVQVWDVATGRELHRWPATGTGPPSLAFSPDGRHLAAMRSAEPPTRTPTVTVWDVATGQRLRQVPLGPPGARQTASWIVYAPDGRSLAVVAGAQPICLVEVATGQVRAEWNVAGANQTADSVTVPGAIAFAPDSRTLYAVTPDNSIVAWDTMSGRDLRRFGEGLVSPTVSFSMRLSADGRLLIVRGRDGLHLYEAATGRLYRRITGSVNLVASTALALSPDGATLAVIDRTGNLRFWDTATGRERDPADGSAQAVGPPPDSPASRPVAATPEPDMTDSQMDRLWDDLAGGDVAKAFVAMRTLTVSPRAGVARLRARLQPADGPSPEKVAQLLADLDSDRFDRREKATRDLADLGEEARAALEKFLAGSPSAEARRRAQDLLKTLDRTAYTPEALRQLRAVEVLEQIGTPEAQTALAELAKGADGARLTRKARAALVRLKRQ